MNFGKTRLIGRPRNRWQDEVTEDGRTVGGEGWQEKVHNREEWKKLLTTARNHCIHANERTNKMFTKVILALYNLAEAEIPTVLTIFNHKDYTLKI